LARAIVSPFSPETPARPNLPDTKQIVWSDAIDINRNHRRPNERKLTMRNAELTAIEELQNAIAASESPAIKSRIRRHAIAPLRKFAVRNLRRRSIFDSALADDVIGEVLAGLTTGTILRSYDPKRGRIGVFILGCVKNECRKIVRRFVRERRLLTHLKAGAHSFRNGDDALEQDELFALLHHALNQLPPRYESALRHYYQVGVLEAVEDPQGGGGAPNTSSLRRRALKKLRAILETATPATEWSSILA